MTPLGSIQMCIRDRYKLFLNTEGVMADVSTDLKAFLDYMGGRPSDHAFVKVLNDEVILAKHNKEWRREYMTLLMRDQENIDKGRELSLIHILFWMAISGRFSGFGGLPDSSVSAPRERIYRSNS